MKQVNKLLIKYIIFLFFLITNTIDPLIASETELPLEVLICSYNVAPWIEKNLDSIFSQEYNNFHVIYIDDASEDGTGALVKEYINKHNLSHKLTLIQNTKRYRKLKNIYNMFHLLDDLSIIIQIDGDDWLPDATVFSVINKVYKSKDVWFTYGQFRYFPSGNIGSCKDVLQSTIDENLFREHPWVFSHLKTFYVWLAKLIKLQDLLAENIDGFSGNFYPAANDVATVLPMLEMAREKIKFIPDVLYVYNQSNPNLGKIVDKNIQTNSCKEIKKLPKYARLSIPIHNRMDKYANSKADCIIFSENNPQGLARLLLSIDQHITGLSCSQVLYQADADHAFEYMELKQKNHTIQFHDVSVQPTLMQSLLNEVTLARCDYILLASDTICLQEDLYITDCIIDLEKTFAHAYYFGLSSQSELFQSTQKKRGKKITYQHIWNDVYAWKFCSGALFLRNALDMILMKKSDLLEILRSMSLDNNSIKTFKVSWFNNQIVDSKKIGLFLKNCKINDSTLVMPKILYNPLAHFEELHNGLI